MIFNAVQFIVYGQAKEAIGHGEKDNPEYKAQFTSVSGAIKQIIKTNGILGCWQGFCTTLIRDTIGVSLYFGFYEIYRRALLKKDQVGAGRCVDA